MRIARSTGFAMSYTQRAAAAAAHSASISTPVEAVVRTAASTWSTPRRGSVTSTDTAESGSGWHRGRILDVSFAAWIPATVATAGTSPFAIRPSRIPSHAFAERRTQASATASRDVGAFPDTSAIRTDPPAPMIAAFPPKGITVIG